MREGHSGRRIPGYRAPPSISQPLTKALLRPRSGGAPPTGGVGRGNRCCCDDAAFTQLGARRSSSQRRHRARDQREDAQGVMTADLMRSKPRLDNLVDLIDDLIGALEISAECHTGQLEGEHLVDGERRCKDNLRPAAASQISRCLRVSASLDGRELHASGFHCLHGRDDARRGRNGGRRPPESALFRRALRVSDLLGTR